MGVSDVLAPRSPLVPPGASSMLGRSEVTPSRPVCVYRKSKWVVFVRPWLMVGTPYTKCPGSVVGLPPLHALTTWMYAA